MFSALKYILIFILFWNSAFADDQIYLLAEPIQQTTELNKLTQRSLIAWDWIWGSAEVFAYFSVTGEPVSSLGVLAYSASSGVPTVQFESRVLQESIAEWKRRKNLQEIARNEGAKEIRVLTTGHSEFTGFYSSKLHSSSFVFLLGSEKPSGNWISIPDLTKAKIQLELVLPDSITHPEKIELSLADLFSGQPLPEESRKSWAQAYQLWSKTRDWKSRYLTDQGINDLKINAVLINADDYTVLGPLASGKGARQRLGENFSQKILNQIRSKIGLSEKIPQISTKNTPIVQSGDCAKWYEILLGKKISTGK